MYMGKGYEVILCSLITDKWSTEIITAMSLEQAEKKAEDKFGKRYTILEVHEKVR